MAGPGSNADTQNGTVNGNSIFSDVHNVLGILLTTFSAVVSFIGVSTGEVALILRNDPGRASLVLLLLALGVLAGVLTVATKNTAGVISPAVLAIVIVMLLGLGGIVIAAIPIGQTAVWLWVVALTIVFAIPLVLLGRWLRGKPGRANGQAAGNNQQSRKETDPPPDSRTWGGLTKRSLSLQVLLIVIGVMLVIISADAAMRLEVRSQLHSTVQVAASISESSAVDTLTVHVTASKVKNGFWVNLRVKEISPGEKLIASGVIKPDVNGGVDNTLAVVLPLDPFQQIRVQACTSGQSATGDCTFSDSQIVLPNPAAPSTTPAPALSSPVVKATPPVATPPPCTCTRPPATPATASPTPSPHRSTATPSPGVIDPP